jgi:hypothetical protein
MTKKANLFTRFNTAQQDIDQSGSQKGNIMKIKPVMKILFFALVLVLSKHSFNCSYGASTHSSLLGNSVKIVSILPDINSTLKVGSSVSITVDVEYSLMQDNGSIVLVVQRGERVAGQQSLLGSVTGEIKRGTGKLTLKTNIIVPETNSIQVFTPLYILGVTRSSTVDMRALKVNGNSTPTKENSEVNQNSQTQKYDYQENENIDGSFYGELRKKYQIGDALISELKYPPPSSAWIESEKSLFQKLLKGHKYDLLVLPFQTQSYGVDHVERMLISYRLAIAIEKITGMKVVPLNLVLPALGGLARFYDEKDVHAFAQELGIQHIIWGYAGTRNTVGSGVTQFEFSLIDETNVNSEAGRKTRCKKWDYETIKPEYLPYQEFETHLNEIIKFLNLDKEKQKKSALDHSDKFNLPLTPCELMSVPKDQLFLRSYLLQYMAMLAPTDYQKTYLFARSIINLFQLEQDSSDRKLIEARAFLHLYSRPAALRTIASVNTPEADALLEYANANLPELESKVKIISPSIKRVLAELELYDLKHKYKKKITKKEISDYVKELPGWEYFISNYFAAFDVWQQPSNIQLKKILDKCFPVHGFCLKDILTGQIIVDQDQGPFKLEMLFQDHIRHAIINDKDALSNSSNIETPLKFDYLILLDSIGVGNLLQQIYFVAFTQGMPEKGIEICDEILKSFKDHPYYTDYKFSILYNVMIRGTNMEKANLRREIYDLALKTMWWNGRQNWVQQSAEKYINLVTKSEEKYIPKDAFISEKSLAKCIDMDYPFRTNNIEYNELRPPLAILPWVHDDVGSFINLYFKSRFMKPRAVGPHFKEVNSELLKEIENRFNGSSGKAKFLITQRVVEQNGDDEKTILLNGIKNGSTDWELYKKLAKLYIFDNQFDEAESVFLMFPEFKNPERYNVVKVSNYAAEAGDIFYRLGDTEHSRIFYKMSTNLDTGSARCLKSAQRLELLEQNIDVAAKLALNRAQRYKSVSGYEDYITYLHVMGEHEKAWSLFKSLISRHGEVNSLWVSAWVGFRTECRSNKDIIKWFNDISQVGTTDREKFNLARLAALCLIDRAPDKAMIKAIEKYDRRVNIDLYNQEYNLSSAAPLFCTTFAKGYEKLMKHDYNGAYEILSQFDYQNGYTAYAAIRAGKMAEYKQRLLRWPSTEEQLDSLFFDKFIIHAVLDCSSGDHESALNYLKKAFCVRPPTMDHAYLTWHYMLEICELLYKQSGDKRYKDLLLKWCAKCQAAQPMFSWSYAMMADYAISQKDKVKNLALAIYLDPNSYRISRFDNNLKQKAKVWLLKNNPFKRTGKSSTKLEL